MSQTVRQLFKLIILIAGLMLCCCPVIAQIELSLESAIDSGLNRSLMVQRSMNNLSLAAADFRQAKLNLLPSVAASPDASFNWGRSLDVSTYNFITQRVLLVNGSLNGQLVLFQGGFLRHQIIRNKMLMEASRSDLDKTKFELVLNIIANFIEIVANQDLLLTATQQYETTQKALKLTQTGLDAGSKSNADVAQFQAQLGTARASVGIAGNRLKASINSLKFLINMQDTDAELRFKTGISGKRSDLIDSSDFIKAAMAFNPAIKLAFFQKQAAQASLKASKVSYYPTLSLYGIVGSNYSDARTQTSGRRPAGFDTVGFVANTAAPVLTPAYRADISTYPLTKQLADNIYRAAGITLQIPVFNKLTTRVNVQKAKLNYQNAELNLSITSAELRKNLAQAWLDLKTAQLKLNTQEEVVSAMRKVVLASEKRYQAGLLNAIDFNTLLNNANKADYDLVQSKYELMFQQKVIEFYLKKS